jgi:hypothetical protein
LSCAFEDDFVRTVLTGVIGGVYGKASKDILSTSVKPPFKKPPPVQDGHVLEGGRVPGDRWDAAECNTTYDEWKVYCASIGDDGDGDCTAEATRWYLRCIGAWTPAD